MDPETNKALALQAFEIIANGGNISRIAEFFAPGCIIHQCGVMEPIRGIERITNFARGGGPFSQRRNSLDSIVADGDTVAARWTMSGRHTSSFLREPTGQQVSFTVMTFARFEDGKIVEFWNNWDMATLMTQLDAWPG